MKIRDVTVIIQFLSNLASSQVIDCGFFFFVQWYYKLVWCCKMQYMSKVYGVLKIPSSNAYSLMAIAQLVAFRSFKTLESCDVEQRWKYLSTFLAFFFTHDHSQWVDYYSEKRLFCESMICPKKCAYGFEVSSDGCALCECRNPCNDVHCPSGRFCVMSDVQCFQQSYCPQQPRCEC